MWMRRSRSLRDSDGSQLKMVSNLVLPMSMIGPVNSVGAGFSKLWYVDVRSDGSCAFQSLGPLAAARPGDAMESIDAKMSDAAYSVENLKKLRGEMRPELIAAGLFADEADAMLNTWENAYFKSPGTRVFFIVPTDWTERVLPVRCSVDANITRVMVGRIDLITPQDREVLRKLADGSQGMRRMRRGRRCGKSWADSPSRCCGIRSRLIRRRRCRSWWRCCRQ